MQFGLEEATKIFVNNKSTLTLAKNVVFHYQSKHINTRYHFIRECIARKEVQLEFVKSHDHVANIFTSLTWSDNENKFKEGR